MSTENTTVFKKENLDQCLKELAKEYKRLVGKQMPAEIILVGGAAILENYGFRDMTTDVDAVIEAASAMKDAIRTVGDRLGLPYGWLNADFQNTGSYSPRLRQYSTHYRTFSGILEIRTVSAEYLIAMKLRSGRKYKNDLSDVIGILAEHEKRGAPLTWEQIDRAVQELYDGWADFPEDAVRFIRDALKDQNYAQAYDAIRAGERSAKELLVDFQEVYPDTLKQENVNSVLQSLERLKQKKNDPER